MTGTLHHTSHSPLADRMRPRSLDEFMGQSHLVGEGRLLRRAIMEDSVSSMLFWGPPGVGKTTLAQIIAQATKREFVAFSAVVSGIKEVRAIVEEARQRLNMERRGTILFVDEIHRFNKAQQDAFLPHVERGIITLIGATTENPSFEVNNALLSRCRVFVLEQLQDADVRGLIQHALADSERGLASSKPKVDDDALELIVNFANGDARAALNALELAVTTTPAGEGGERHVTRDIAQQALRSRITLYDQNGEEHYNLISALHKSLRGSDVQAAVYWLMRMLECGEDPLYVARRMIRFASEDIGLADPQALVQAIAARDAVHMLGLPEGDNALAQCAIYLATAPKSNSVYMAVNKAKEDVQKTRNDPVPLDFRNAPTKLMGELGYGDNYQYDHDAPNHYSGQSHLPPALQKRNYYEPGQFGFEKDIKRRIDYWNRLRQERQGGKQ